MAPLAVIPVDCPAQIAAVAGLALTVGNAFTVMVTLAVFVHPLASVPVITYVEVPEGLADTVVPLPEESPEVGLQV